MPTSTPSLSVVPFVAVGATLVRGLELMRRTISSAAWSAVRAIWRNGPDARCPIRLRANSHREANRHVIASPHNAEVRPPALSERPCYTDAWAVLR